MANFEIAISKVLQWEGGYSDHPNDTGNYNSLGLLTGTNYGITSERFEMWFGYPPSVADMKNLSLAEAKQIYFADFWQKIKGNEIQNQAVANIILDGVVQHLIGVKLLQEVLEIPADNIFGNQTLQAVNSADPRWLYLAYKERRRKYYHWLVDWRPDNAPFLNGWLNRINSFKDYAGSVTLPGDGGDGFAPLLMVIALVIAAKALT